MKSPPEKRYKHFVSVAADWGEVWCLRDSKASVFIEGDSGSIALPVWPIREFAELYARESNFQYSPERIPVEIFLSETLPAMEESGKLISVLPKVGDTGLVIASVKLAADIQSEIDRFG